MPTEFIWKSNLLLYSTTIGGHYSTTLLLYYYSYSTIATIYSYYTIGGQFFIRYILKQDV
jgi:hypothetical protein